VKVGRAHGRPFVRRGASSAALLVLLAFSAPAWAQFGDLPDAPGIDNSPSAEPADRASGRPDPSAVPDVGELVRVVDQATGPRSEGETASWSAPVRLAIVFAVLAVMPALLVMMTSFTRIVIVLSFARRALSTQTIPPNIAIIGLALFLTLFVMSPTIARINTAAVQPYTSGQIEFDQAVTLGSVEMKDFMLRQTREADLAMFVDMSGIAAPSSVEDVPMHVAIPAFAISEFRTAFEMGCLLFIPFLLVDLVISGVLLSAGMMMLPPVIISLPFKIVLFVLVDGWRLLASSLVNSFNY
jgi:flagellar biosynthetic protein FliP